MSSIVDPVGGSNQGYRRRLFPLSVAVLALLFAAAPWSTGHKAHMLLHGLCAQRPSHTFMMGSSPLPFDARMTGIYGGFLMTGAYLMARGRHRRGRLPRIPVMVLLGAFVGAMAIDGFNSLFLDMRIGHPYEPSNVLRLITGAATGISLAVVLAYLCAISLWRRPDTASPLLALREIPTIALLQAPFCLLILAGPGWLATPVTIALLLSAVSVVSLLALVTVVLWRRADNSFTSLIDIQGYATAALMLGTVAMGVLAIGRALLERWMGPSPLG